jgi:hypothetical protein
LIAIVPQGIALPGPDHPTVFEALDTAFRVLGGEEESWWSTIQSV